MIFNLTDWIIVAVIITSGLFGAWRGFVRESLSIITWTLALCLGFKYALSIAELLVGLVDTDSIRRFLGFFMVFLGTLIVGEIISILVRKIVRITGLGPLNRCLGILFGVVRGAIITVAVVLLLSHTAVIKDKLWQQSQLLPWFITASKYAQQYLPEGLINAKTVTDKLVPDSLDEKIKQLL